MREIMLDTETTGLSAKGGDRIVEIGCLEVINLVPSGAHFHTYLNPKRDVPISASNVHGLTADFLADKPLFADIADALLEFIGDAPVVIHNAPFDIGFLSAEFAALKRAWPESIEIIDSLVMARKKFPGAPASLDALCKRFRVDNSERDKHGALLDATLLAEVYLHLRGGPQASLADLEEDSNSGAKPDKNKKAPEPKQEPKQGQGSEQEPEQSQDTPKNTKARPRAASEKTSRLSAEDKAAHLAYMKTLKDSAWLKES